MHSDEDETFRRWVELRDGVIRPALEDQDGTLVKSTGDGILATFPEAVQGARWARAVQLGARARRQSLALRISLNVCPIIYDAADIAGDGVNIAARLQEHAPEGGIILTESVKSALADSPDIALRPLGEVKLRKMRHPIEAWELVTDGRPVARAPEATTDDSQVPSIAVLPFINLGGNPDDDYFANGIVEDVVVSLSSLREMTVISRSSTLAFARQDVDPRTIGKVLGVRYVITGSVRRAPERLRISTELVDTSTGATLVIERREFTETDLFDVQDAIVEAVISRLVPGLRAAERRRVLRKRPENFTAYDLTLRALDLIGSLEREQFDAAFGYLEQAIALDPAFATPLAWSARWYSLRIGQGWSTDPRHDQLEAASRAMRDDMGGGAWR